MGVYIFVGCRYFILHLANWTFGRRVGEGRIILKGGFGEINSDNILLKDVRTIS